MGIQDRGYRCSSNGIWKSQSLFAGQPQILSVACGWQSSWLTRCMCNMCTLLSLKDTCPLMKSTWPGASLSSPVTDITWVMTSFGTSRYGNSDLYGNDVGPGVELGGCCHRGNKARVLDRQRQGHGVNKVLLLCDIIRGFMFTRVDECVCQQGTLW